MSHQSANQIFKEDSIVNNFDHPFPTTFEELVPDTLRRIEALRADPRIVEAGKLPDLDRAKQILLELERRMAGDDDLVKSEGVALMNDVVSLIMQATNPLRQRSLDGAARKDISVTLN